MKQTDFQIRPWTDSDLHSLVKYANNFKVAKNLTDGFPHPYTEEHGIKFIKFAQQNEPPHLFAIDVNGEAVGGIGVLPQNDVHRLNAELGYWLAEPFWGQGIITRAVSEILKFAFENYDIDRVFARPFSTNIASQKVLQKNNFILEARFKDVLIKNGEIIDELIFAVRRKDFYNIT
jgi:RimJ/RimL family protein N-acetyltransferase